MPVKGMSVRPRTMASIATVTVAAVTVGTFAVLYDGKPTTEVDLNDGGVWLTKTSSLMVGHFNKQSEVLDGGLRTTTASFDLQQSESRVLVVDQTANTMTAVDPARVALSDAADLPAGGTVSLGGDTVAVVDAAGSLWTAPFSAVGSFTADSETALGDLGDGARATVAVDGTVYAASAEQAMLFAYGRAADDTTTVTGSRELPGVEKSHTLSVSAVGNTAFVLDEDTDTLYGSDGSQTAVPDGAVLQQPSVTADAVTLATPTELVRVPIGQGDEAAPATIPTGGAEGAPAAPVFVAGCAYGAWSGVGMFVRDCPGDGDDVSEAVEAVEPTSVLQFRVNRDVVVLNDVFGGDAWMVSDAMQRVDQWDTLTPPEGEGQEEEEPTEETVQTTLPERSEKNTDPIAKGDLFGARPGRTTILPVLDNDTDADGDVLVASVLSDPEFGDVEVIYNGAALQITLDESASGSTSFRYKVEDGRGGDATASVTVEVHDPSQNAAPVQKRKTSVPVESGGTASYNVIVDWIDPDGDDIFLQEVAPANGDEADFTSDGQISYRAIGGLQGRVEMPIVVSDGKAATTGVAVYDVQPIGATQPITAPDHVVTRVGQAVEVAPLVNDTSASGEPLRLARVDEVDGATISPSYGDDTFTFTADEVDTYYVQYLASTGPVSVPGIVRIDVLPEADEILPPVAVRDVALLPSGGDVLVNVLGNDTDPVGGILVVQSVEVEPGSGVTAAVLGHESVRITDQGGIEQQVRVTYTISNGYDSATGDIIVIPVPAASKVRAPVAVEDKAVVRAGDIVTIPVLENDYHPNGHPISLAPDLVEVSFDDAAGEIFTSENELRFRAGTEPQTVYATYEVLDDQGQRDAALVTIQILPRNDETNAAPRPRDLVARVLGGSTVTIPVPLDGIDEDGDSVELVGLDSAPTQGRIVETGVDHFTYEAFAGATGLDTFRYRVRDHLGKEATASVQVGIAPVADINHAPYAARDTITMRPGRQVAVPVLENDSDPDGDRIGFAGKGVKVPDVDGLDAEVSGRYLLITAPDEPMHTSVSYTIADSRGLSAATSVQITVDESVPLEPPIARDDRVAPEEITEEGTVTVAALENDDDPDGTRSALTVTLGTGSENATVDADGVVAVTLTAEPQLITYTITDIDELTASAFIRVPALESLAPTIDPALDLSAQPVEVLSGETVTIPLSDYVRVADGSRVVITEASRVSAGHANGDPLIKDQTTLQYTSAEDYVGPDALTFEVTDGNGPDDPEGRKAMLTIPITVLPPANVPPTMVGAEMVIAPGEEPSTLDLAALATDPDEDDTLTFSLVSEAPAGITAALDGTTLSVGSAANTPKGTTVELTVEVTDGEAEPVQATIVATVAASTRELASVNDDVIDEADQGVRLPVNVLINDISPFEDAPLTIMGTELEVGIADVTFEGDTVYVTPGPTYVGNVVVRYTVQDKTEDQDRWVDGRIRIAVQGRPDMPGKPTVTSVQSRTVVLSWTPPADNGTPITGYTVTSTRGDYTKECASTTCTLDGLTNNVEYNFVVTATNRVGVSDPSVPSETARPDVRPETPVAPTLGFGDQSLDVSWTVPKTEGSPVESYTLQISPAPPSGVTEKTGVTGTSLVWSGLENGVPYQVRVRAHNRAPEPSDFSAWSQSMIPARAPDAPATPTTARLDPVGSQAQIQVAWSAPAANGDPISGYQVQVLRGGSLVNTVAVPAGQTTQAIVVDASETDYTFRVRAQNKAGWGEWSSASAPRRGFSSLGAPTIGTATEGDNRVSVTWTAGSRGGATTGEVRYEYAVNGGSWRSDWVSGGTSGSGTIGNGQVNNNGTYSITVRAVATVDGYTGTSPSSAASNKVAPYGPIANPKASASASGRTVSYSWSSPTRNGRDITTQVNLNGAGWKTVAASGSGSTTLGYSTNFTISVRTTAAGQTTTASASAKTGAAPPPPQPRVWVSKGAVSGSCNRGPCKYYVVNTENFPAGSYEIGCVNNRDGEFNSWKGPFRLPANGSVQLTCWLAPDGLQAWVDIKGWGDSVDTEKRAWP